VRRRWRLLLLLMLALAGCGVETVPLPTPAVPTEVRIVDREPVAERQVDLTVASPAVGRPVKVRLLLPEGFDADPTRLRPVLYLLHGCCDTYVSWTRSTDIEELTRDLDLIVVMPDGGRAGFYSDWRSGPQWEQFHLSELPALLAEEFGAEQSRAIAGVSMGGLGALGYAARHPGMFRAAASFSGIVHTRLTPQTPENYLGLLRSEGEDPYALWGYPEADVATWDEYNPYALADRLAGTAVYLACGDGRPGPLDPEDRGTDRIEVALGRENEAFAERIRRLEPRPTVNLYGPGSHTWVYWNRELRAAWPMITDALGR
jgi:diacylglycerol O-acyltransferase/trehalose O-mycolyltransferase